MTANRDVVCAMLLLEKSLATPAENLALDEVLLDSSEAVGSDEELLRIWESPQYVAVLGRASRAGRELDLDACAASGIPVMRRVSGGAAVVIGPGCLMYSLVLSSRRRPQLRMIEQAHDFVLGVVAAAVAELTEKVQKSGTSDLTRGGRKFSGNSLRCKRNHLLYHGTLLYDFPLELITRCLRLPPRRPLYRGDRSHAEFLANLPVSGDQLRDALARHWRARQLLTEWPEAETLALATRKYGDEAWTFGR